MSPRAWKVVRWHQHNWVWICFHKYNFVLNRNVLGTRISLLVSQIILPNCGSPSHPRASLKLWCSMSFFPEQRNDQRYHARWCGSSIINKLRQVEAYCPREGHHFLLGWCRSPILSWYLTQSWLNCFKSLGTSIGEKNKKNNNNHKNNKANLRDFIAATGQVILLKLDSNHRIFSPCDLEIWWMTPKNNRAPLLCYLRLFASFRSHWLIQTGVTTGNA